MIAASRVAKNAQNLRVCLARARSAICVIRLNVKIGNVIPLKKKRTTRMMHHAVKLVVPIVPGATVACATIKERPLAPFFHHVPPVRHVRDVGISSRRESHSDSLI
jgi:hypothetical protein